MHCTPRNSFNFVKRHVALRYYSSRCNALQPTEIYQCKLGTLRCGCILEKVRCSSIVKYMKLHISASSAGKGDVNPIDNIKESMREVDGISDSENNMKQCEGKCPARLKLLLDQSCQKIYDENRPTQQELLRRKSLCNQLEQILRDRCNSAIRLELFGSSVNGFTLPESDLDMCMTFEGCATDEKVPREVLLAVKDVMHDHNKFHGVRALLRPKIPIVQFGVKGEKFKNGDLSLYNKLGVHNTRLISTYADIDQRFRILGYTFKHFMNQCKTIKLARLTSYSYMMMLIYFLQQCNPPVLPVLQQLHEGRKVWSEEEGWNVWFYEDLGSLPKVWSSYGKNTASVGELWFQMLHYYANVFDFDSHVVSIRRKGKLTKEMKLRDICRLMSVKSPLWKRDVSGHHWTKPLIRIEDPFVLIHNLTAVLSRESSVSFQGMLKGESRRLHDMGKKETSPSRM